MSNEMKAICSKYLVNAYRMGQKVDPMSTDNSEYYLPMIDLDIAPKMVEEILSRPTEPKTKIAEIDKAIEDIEYHYEGMGCGLEDMGITDRYQAMEHGWEYICPSCYTTFKGFVSKNTTRFKCDCGQELIVGDDS